jgi:glycosyltransferase involved in cell wall biosynthesis
MNIKISVIVPVYNTKDYLERCLNSILNQTLDNIEIVIVNDNSTDESELIIKEFVNKFKNIKYLKNEKNIGVSSSRNKALLECNGEYILFVDSDDYLEPSMLEEMYNEAQINNLDIVTCGYFLDYEDGNTNVLVINLDTDKIYSGKEMLAELLHHKSGVTGHSWNKIIRKSIILDNNITYPSDMRLYEDLVFFTKLYPFCNRIKNIKKSFYHYIQRGQSAVKIVDEKVIFDTEKTVINVKNALNSQGVLKDLQSEFNAFVSRMISIAMHKIYMYSNDNSQQKEYLSKLINLESIDIKNSNKNLDSKYIYDLFHKFSLIALKSTNYNVQLIHINYKSLINLHKGALKIYKTIRSK